MTRQIITIADARDPRIELFTALTDVDLRQRIEPERGFFMAEGHLVIERCARSGLDFRAVLTERRWLARLEAALAGVDTAIFVADQAVLTGITGYRVHRGALAAVNRPPALGVTDLLANGGDVLVLEDLVDPTNVGLAIRSAAVQGISDVLISPGCADPLYRKAVKSSMATVLACRWSRSDDWPGSLRALAQERRLIALTPSGDVHLDSALRECTTAKVALAVGSEGPGLSDLAMSTAWRRCAIPMSGEGASLNVAAAVAVASYARSRSIEE